MFFFFEKDLHVNVVESLKLENSKTLKFYASPEIHKQGNPMRRVVKSISFCTSNFSKFVDLNLQPQLPLYVKDTPDFIKKVRDTRKHEGCDVSIYGCGISIFQYS